MALTDAERATREAAYIEMIGIYAGSGESDPHLFRTLLDGWVAYRMGGPFLNRNGRPRWFNNVQPADLGKLGNALWCMDFISAEAAAVLEGRAAAPLVKEHGCPVRIIRDRIIHAAGSDSAAFRRILVDSSWLGVVTKEEDIRITGAGLRASLPDCSSDQFRERYRRAGIREWPGDRPFEILQNPDHEYLMEIVRH